MEANTKKTLYTAFKPTGDLQLGNYLGVLRRLKDYQDDYNCIFTVADMHSLTVPGVPADLRRRSYEFMATFASIGLDPAKSIMFVQSHVPAHAELTWVLNCNTMMGEANRMTQYKDKSKKVGKDGITVGLFDYPVLMAADILLYNADVVPVGKDQVQHLELARNIADRFNGKYSPTFTVPDALVGSKASAKIFSLTDPTAKMGKTDDNADGVVFLLDKEDDIMRKFRRAVTDSETEIRFASTKPGISNLLSIYAGVTDMTIKQAESRFSDASYATFKQEVGEAVVSHLAPFKQKYTALLSDKKQLEEMMRDGANRAAYVARKTLSKVYRKVGFVTI